MHLSATKRRPSAAAGSDPLHRQRAYAPSLMSNFHEEPPAPFDYQLQVCLPSLLCVRNERDFSSRDFCDVMPSLPHYRGAPTKMHLQHPITHWVELLGTPTRLLPPSSSMPAAEKKIEDKKNGKRRPLFWFSCQRNKTELPQNSSILNKWENSQKNHLCPHIDCLPVASV
ncbi:hypothetical protein KP509_1Z295300 [Ceratopteris richardii]|nr:hypothetical protein KP509_1Z295300 [Ceratopteris richardii]